LNRRHEGTKARRHEGENETERAKAAALDVLRHNIRGPIGGLPRTAGWGYPEPYTRDWMISALGVLVSEDRPLIDAVGRVLEALARHQTASGHIPSLAHRPTDVGASDTTPLFLIGAALYRRAIGNTPSRSRLGLRRATGNTPSRSRLGLRRVTGNGGFLDSAIRQALTWMRYQSPEDLIMVAQQPTSDWRDEQWVLGYGLYVNTLVYTYLRLYGLRREADALSKMMHFFAVGADEKQRDRHEGLAVFGKPYYAMWSYKVYSSERFDLLGNSIAILSGVASPARARRMIRWIEDECAGMRERGVLATSLPPCFFPFIQREDPDWRPRYERFNRPGQYHNGGVWPFVCGFYVAALVAAGRMKLARQRLQDLTELVAPARDHDVAFGFNEWFDATTGQPRGEDWQTWSAAMYYYAATCVEQGRTPFFDEVRGSSWKSLSKRAARK